ncbi:protein TEX261 [Daktulosphaira vitifoliae]|uniref:protein TEX261 n=1 Tax=Daktulosphaira vitifoliae TaxID=58002 RepID=UPI0021AABADB|nr:protein TEX261 [Daktulosphaira vitifoliae]
MVFMLIVTILATVTQIALISVFIGAGLYFLAEFVEEHNTITKKLIKWTINIIILCHLGLYFFDDVSFDLIAIGLLSHGVYYFWLSDFPYISFTSLSFVFSLVLLIFSHGLAFKFFVQRHSTFLEVLSYFTICIWMVPFMYVVSLSANDNILPTTNSEKKIVSGYFNNQNRSYKLKNIFNYIADMTTKNDHLKY